MSLYQLNKIMYLLELDARFLTGMKINPAETIKNMDLTKDERTAVLTGDVGKLYLMGVNLFILDSIARHELFGMTRNSYLEQIRVAAQQSSQQANHSSVGVAGSRRSQERNLGG
jgi:hypothetical protein